ncbi:MAG: Flp pilus assembly protein CpaB [Deltaproteobacteria bacterium]|nr:Flp pilus assembly protein CpaB [Deltaproteobacteria bacterium]
MKIKRPMIAACLAGFASLVLVWGFLKAKEMQFNNLEEPIAVVVAKKDILESTHLDASILTLQKIPRRFLQPGVVTSLEQAVGMVTAAPILKGEQMLGTKLVGLGVASGLSVRIPQGFRALSIEVDDVSGVAGLVRPNNFIDLLATFEMEDATDTTQVSTYTLAQKVLVLAVASDIGAGFNPSTLSNPKAKKNILGGEMFAEALTSQHKKTVTLALTPGQVQTVEFAKNSGTLSLSLRSQWEEEPLNLNPATALDVVGFKGKMRKGYREYRGR